VSGCAHENETSVQFLDAPNATSGGVTALFLSKVNTLAIKSIIRRGNCITVSF
jgi:hypothetical protein